MAEIIVTEQAKNDIRDIFYYISMELRAEWSAKRQAARIMNAIEELAFFPEKFPVYQVEPWKSRGLHLMPVDRYLVAYLVQDGGEMVVVLRVMYGKRDVRQILMENEQSKQQAAMVCCFFVGR